MSRVEVGVPNPIANLYLVLARRYLCHRPEHDPYHGHPAVDPNAANFEPSILPNSYSSEPSCESVL